MSRDEYGIHGKCYVVKFNGPEHISVQHMGGGKIATYQSFEALPVWMQQRVAVLYGTPGEPPTYPVEGVGRRMSPLTYWLYGGIEIDERKEKVKWLKLPRSV